MHLCISGCFALPFFLHAAALVSVGPQPQPTCYGRTLNELINSLGSEAPKTVKQDTYSEVCPGERCEVHGNSLAKGVAPVYYGLFKATDEKGLALEEAAERFFPHAKFKVFGGCAEKKAREARVSYCPWCRWSLEKWLKAPTYVARPRPIEQSYKDIRIGMEEEELMKLMGPYKRLYSEHGQWPKWADGHIIVSITIWPDGDVLSKLPSDWGPFKVQGKEIVKEVFDEKKWRWIVRPTWDRVAFDPNKRILWPHDDDEFFDVEQMRWVPGLPGRVVFSHKTVLKTLANMPKDIEGDYWTCLEGDCARLAARSDDAQMWEALEKATRQARVGLRMQLLENVGRTALEERPERERARRLAFLATFLDDAEVRDSTSDPKKYLGIFAGYAYKPHLEVRNLVALKMAEFFKTEVEKNPSRTDEEWAQLRNRVREVWGREEKCQVVPHQP
jgi:hypothetical protein